ncbi:MAG: prepilin peptidase [Candidatus Thorarchaeota archaeon]
MSLDITFASIMSFFTITLLLVVYSILDLKDRRVRNEFIIAGGLVGGIVLIFTGHLTSNLVLHSTAFLLVVPIAYILFRIGSIGGADVKVLYVLAFISPGIELGILSEPVLEAIIGLGGELVVMLLGGYFYWRWRDGNENLAPPLIPFLLTGYLTIQIFALF